MNKKNLSQKSSKEVNEAATGAYDGFQTQQAKSQANLDQQQQPFVKTKTHSIHESSKQTLMQNEQQQFNVNKQESDKVTFVTGLIDEQKEPHLQAQDQLDIYVSNIDGQFAHVLGKHEEDFVNAYKSHLVKVQRELVYLKGKAEEAAGKVLNDDTVTNLQKQINWFKNEAIKLDQILETQKRELQKLKSRELNLGEDRKFLRGQIKDAMKHNKLLQVAVNKTNQTNKSLKEFLQQNQIEQKMKLRQQQRKSCQMSPTSIINQTMAQYNQAFITQKNQESGDENGGTLQHQMQDDMMSQESSDFKVKEFILDLFKRGYDKDKIESKVAKFFKIYDLSRDQKIDNLQRRIELYKKANSKGKTAQAQEFAEKSEIENLFLDSMDESKKEILKRKALNGGVAEAKFQNNIIQENTQSESQILMEQVVLNKECLIGVFEQMFGSGGYIGSAIQNIEHQIKNKKYSLVSQGADNNLSYFSNATTKDYQSEEMERVHIIMNAPIENLLCDLKSLSKSQTRVGAKKSAYSHYDNNSISSQNKRASTAIAKTSALNQTAISYYNDQITENQIKPRPITSQSYERGGGHFKFGSATTNDQKSRQQNTQMTNSSAREKSFSVRNGKLMIVNTTNASNNQNNQ